MIQYLFPVYHYYFIHPNIASMGHISQMMENDMAQTSFSNSLILPTT